MTNFIRLAVFFCLVGSASVWADVQEINGNKGEFNWNVVTTDKGCIVYFYGSPLYGEVYGRKSITWSGNCQKGKLISDYGTLTFMYSPEYTPDVPQDYDGLLGYLREYSWTGQVIDGFLHGSVTYKTTFNPVSEDKDGDRYRSSEIKYVVFKHNFIMGCTPTFEVDKVEYENRVQYPRCKSKRPSQAEDPTTLGDDPQVLGGRFKP